MGKRERGGKEEGHPTKTLESTQPPIPPSHQLPSDQPPQPNKPPSPIGKRRIKEKDNPGNGVSLRSAQQR